jgi:hypothetical protein
MREFLAEVNRFLLFLADIPMPQFPQPLLRQLDRYARTGRHRVTGDGTRVQATVLVLRERNRRYQAGFVY